MSVSACPAEAPNEPMVTLSLVLHATRLSDFGGYLLSADGDRQNAVWIPKRQVVNAKMQGEHDGDGVRYRITLPRWLATTIPGAL